MLNRLNEWDRNALIYLNNLGSEPFDPFWLSITTFVNWTPLLLLIIYLLFKVYNKSHLKWILLSYTSMLVISTVVTFIFKFSVARLRPSVDPSINSLIRVGQEAAEYSLISGHASSSFAIVTFAVLLLNKKGWMIYLLYLWPILFSISRVYLGVHYPLDIIAGGLVGVFIALLFYRMHMKFKAPYIL